ncbi:MAG: hypothetical protein AAFX93_02090 [Verrucomicrobiota bacterium]
MSNASNWSVGGVPSTPNNANNQILTFGAETGGAPDYIVVLDQGNNKDSQNVGTLDVTGGTSGYTFNQTGDFFYTIYGANDGFGNGNSILNSSGNLATFNVDILQANNDNTVDQSIWDAGTGGLEFNNTIAFASNAKNVEIVNGTADINGTISLSNTTGSQAIVFASTGSTVNINGTVGDAGSVPSAMRGIGTQGGTLLLAGPAGSDLIAGEQGSRRTSLEVQGGTFGFTADDSLVRNATFERGLTLTSQSDIQFGDDVGGGIIQLNGSGNSNRSEMNDVRLYLTNWNGQTHDFSGGNSRSGGGTDQFVFADLENNGVAVVAGDDLFNVRIFNSGTLFYGRAVGRTDLGAGFIEIVPGNIAPVPEPSTYAFGGLLIATIGIAEWRRRRSKRLATASE